ncbi:hypothetical protein WA026_019601 [Henosepilachna vigintioctopunctata]|uniref:Sulfatase N-terminal domain-containing protein n=1 Tax=Henosepilachna vigintioctopunctata TaxID=420089 RepID=A0AAW1TMR4_9CUCU
MNIEVLRAFSVVILCISSYIYAQGMKQNSPPHIVMIVADDLGSNDLSYRGFNQITTPNLDAMGFNGIILNRHYTEAICTPSRAALLTGQYPIRIGMQGEPLKAGEDRHLPSDVQTLPQLLKERGYDTYLVGKWHLGPARRDDTPTRKGFDYHYGYWNGYVGYFDHEIPVPISPSISYNGYDMKENFKDAWIDKGKYATHLFTEKALDVIDQQNIDTPMFLMITHLAAHTGKDGLVEGYDEQEMNNTYSYVEDLQRRRYLDAVRHLDDSVGKIVEKLQQRNMLQNSVVVFMADNGAQINGRFKNAGSNFPLRGEKFSHHEGGIRNAAVIYSPLLEKRNYVHDELIHITDWFPTLYSLAGYAGRYKLLNGTIQSGFFDTFSPEPTSLKQMDYDVAAILNSPVNKAIEESKSNPVMLDETLITGLRKYSSALRQFPKCMNKPENPEICKKYCLFDLWIDPCETENLINDRSKAKIVSTLKTRLQTFWRQVSPQTNKNVDVNSNPAKYNGTWCTWLDDELCVKTRINADY